MLLQSDRGNKRVISHSQRGKQNRKHKRGVIMHLDSGSRNGGTKMSDPVRTKEWKISSVKRSNPAVRQKEVESLAQK